MGRRLGRNDKKKAEREVRRGEESKQSKKVGRTKQNEEMEQKKDSKRKLGRTIFTWNPQECILLKGTQSKLYTCYLLRTCPITVKISLRYSGLV